MTGRGLFAGERPEELMASVLHGRRRFSTSDDNMAWSFSEQCDRASDMNDLRDLLQVEFQRLGFRYFACVSRVRSYPSAIGAETLHNYPKSWVDRYREAQYFRRDPIFLLGRDLVQPFLWRDQVFEGRIEADQLAILEDASRHGLLHGVTIPLHGPAGDLAYCSLVSDAPDIDGDRVHLAARFARCAHETGRRLAGPALDRPRISLPRRERQCMELVALGKDDEAIAIILGNRSGDGAGVCGDCQAAPQRHQTPPCRRLRDLHSRS
jgi:LuxR family transcriptional regulator, quorum-sensing system regulator CciR